MQLRQYTWIQHEIYDVVKFYRLLFVMVKVCKPLGNYFVIESMKIFLYCSFNGVGFGVQLWPALCSLLLQIQMQLLINKMLNRNVQLLLSHGLEFHVRNNSNIIHLPSTSLFQFSIYRQPTYISYCQRLEQKVTILQIYYLQDQIFICEM